MGLGAIAVVVAGYFTYSEFVAKPKELEASDALGKVELWMEVDSLNWAVAGNGEAIGLEGIIDQYSGTDAANRAHYYLGCIKRDQGDFQGALDQFTAADIDDHTISILNEGNIGDMQVELGNYDQAADYLEKAARKAQGSKSSDMLAPMYYMKAARVQMERQDNEKAIGLLEQITENYKRSQEYGDAVKIIAMLKAGK